MYRLKCLHWGKMSLKQPIQTFLQHLSAREFGVHNFKLNMHTHKGLWRRRTSPRRESHVSVVAACFSATLASRVCGGDVPSSHVNVHDCLLG